MVTVPSTRRIARQHHDGITLHRALLTERELEPQCTAPVRTVIDCARDLPFDEALSVADSALRSGLVTQGELAAAAAASLRTGRRKTVRVAEAADGRAANPFESVLRAIALEVPGLQVEPQLTIGTRDAGDLVVLGRVDLADLVAGLIIEAESWEHHRRSRRIPPRRTPLHLHGSRGLAGAALRMGRGDAPPRRGPSSSGRHARLRSRTPP